MFVRRLFSLAILLAIGSSVAVFGQSRLIYVNKSTGKDTSIAGTQALPFAKIQTGIDSARNGDTVFVARGNYIENVDLKGKSIALISNYFYSNDTTDIVNTKIDGNLNGSVGLLISGASYVNGFNVTNSYPGGITVSTGGASLFNIIAEYNQGTGISISAPQGSIANLSNIITRYNQGTGFLEFLAVVKVLNLQSYYNDADGIHLQRGVDTISNALIYGNKNRGIWVWNSNSYISHATVFGNTQTSFWSHAGGFLRIYNSILCSNTTTGVITDARALIYNSVVENGAAGINRNIETFLTYDSSNNSRDPKFIDTASRNFRLSNFSSALGNGIRESFHPLFDIAGNIRPNPAGSAPDAGAYENIFKHQPPINISAEGGNQSVRLRWTQIPGNRISKFKVFRSTSPIPDNATAGVVTDTISVGRLEYIDATGLTNLTRYYYRMKTVDSSGVESGMSNEVSVVPNTLSSKVTSVRVSSSSRLVGVRWAAISGFKYNVYRGTERGLLNLVAKEISDSVFLDSSVLKNQRYFYNVRSVDSVGVPGVPSDTLEIRASGYFYVSPEGSDLDGGSNSSPFKTINRALRLAQSTDTIILKAGIHRERLNIKHTQRPLTIGSEYILIGDTSLIRRTILEGSTIMASTLIYDSTVVYGNVNNEYNQLIGFTISGSRGAIIDGANRWNVRRMNFVGNLANNYLFHNVPRLNIDSSLFEANGSEINDLGLVFMRDSGTLRNTIFKNNLLEGHLFLSDGGFDGDSVVVSGNLFLQNRHRYNWSHRVMIHPVNTFRFIFRDNIVSKNEFASPIYVYTADRTDCKWAIYNNTVVNNNTRNGVYGSVMISSRAQSEINIYNNIIQGNLSNDNQLQVNINPEGGSLNGARLNILNNIIGSDSVTARINNLNQINVIRNTSNTFNPVSFVDSARGDYRLQNWSWGIGMGYAGNDLPKSIRDFAGGARPNPVGSAPDLGAHENLLSIPTAFIDNIQRSGDSIFIPWSFFERSLVDSLILFRSIDTNVESASSLRRAFKLASNQLMFRDTLTSGSVYYYGIRIRMTNGSYTTLSNIKPSNTLSKKTSFLPQLVNPKFVWGDIDADGDLDLAVMGETPGIFFQLYRNNAGTFVEVFNRTQVPQLFKGTMKFADIDNDGDIDLVASGQRTTAINNLGTFLFKNDGAGNFTFNEIIDIVSTREGDMAFGDHDNDGDLDMALSGIDVNGLSRLTVYNNNGKGTFSIERRLFPSQGGPSDPLYSDLQWVDYDNDGDQDLVFSGRASGASAGIVTNTLFNSNQTNNFSGSNIRYYSEWALRNAAVETADLNADGWVDIIVSGSIENGSILNRQTRIIYGSPNGFQTAALLPLDNIAGQVRVADFDNDGDLDILVSGLDQQASPKTVFYLNTGTGSGFEKKSYEIIPNLDRSAFSWADYDNDGDLDLVISGQKPASQGGQVISEIYTFEPEKKNLSPSKPAKPSIQNFGDGRIIVSWSSGKDDLTPASSLNYLLKIGTVSLTGIPAQSYTVVESNKNGGTLLNPETGLIYGTNYFTQLNPGRYYFLLQVVDHNKLTSQPSDTLFLTLAYPWKFVIRVVLLTLQLHLMLNFLLNGVT